MLIGVTWDGAAAGVSVRIRLREGDGWTSWQEVEPADTYPDSGSADAKRAGSRQATEPLVTPGADAYQVAVDAPDGQRLSNVEAVLVDPRTSGADATVGQAPAGSAVAVPAAPGMISRAAWGADENLRLTACPEGPSYSSTVKVAFVHHTADTDSYSADQVPAMLRSIYAYHVQGRGWCDIGYNFLIDKFGRVFEGRFGGTHNPVIGAHTGGFNTNTVGISLIGTYTSAGMPAAMQNALESTLAWKLGMHGANPYSQDVLTSGGSANSRYPAGQAVAFNVISGHRDAAFTECPGDAVYNVLPYLRVRIGQRISDPSFVTALYHDMLTRWPDPGGVEYWSNVLAGGQSRQAVVAAMSRSGEFQISEVWHAYAFALRRAPSGDGLAEGIRILQTGIRPSHLAVLLMTTNEFYQRWGATPEWYVNGLFQVLLNRPADAGNMAYWGDIVRQQGRWTAAASIYNSLESGYRRIERLYQRYLGGPPGDGYNGAPALVAQGDESVRDALVLSPLYAWRAQARFP